MAASRIRSWGCIWRTSGVACCAVLGAAAALGITASSPAGAQDGWAPVVIAAAPPQDPTDAAEASALRSRPRPGLRGSLLPPALSPQWDGMPPLATLAAQAASAPEQRGTPARLSETDPRLAREYCLNIADPATDARFAWQKKVIADLEQGIAKRIELLEARTAEYQRWLARRDEFSKKAQETVVTIYARMRPEAAAAQLVAMDEEMAAAVLTRLDPRNASAILNEMEASQAARLTATIAGAANVNLPGRSKPQPGDKKS